MQETKFNDELFAEIFKEETQSKTIDKMNDRLMELEQKGHKLKKRSFYENMQDAKTAQKLALRRNKGG